MIRVCRRGLWALLSLVIVALVPGLCAQGPVPATTTAIPDLPLATATGTASIDLKNYFTLPGVAGPVVQFNMPDYGRFNVELLTSDAPNSVTNFLAYVDAGTYNGTIIHRSTPLGANNGNGIVQGGGYNYVLPPTAVTKRAPIALEYKQPNIRGTLSMARTSVLNSATSEWFFNVADNTSVLGQANNGGYAVFGRVLGTGMSVVDAVYATPTYNANDQTDPNGPFGTLPLRGVAQGQTSILLTNLVQISNIARASLFPADGTPSVISFIATSANSDIATVSVSGSTLTVTPVAAGSTSVTVRAADTNGSVANSTFTVTVNGVVSPPAFTSQPVAQTVASGSTVVFNAAASGSPTYQWKRDGASLNGATAATLVITGATQANAGSYTVEARNSAGTATSSAATLTINGATATEVGRLVNLSILTNAGTGSRILTVGASVGPLTYTEKLPLVVRGVGPGLREFFGITGALADPTMTVYAAGSTAPIGENDNWGSGNADALAAAFTSVGAFPLSPGSLDSAYANLSPGFGVGGYTVQVAGKGTASGTVIAEIYDASGNNRTATTPRLVNLSTRAQIDAGGDLRTGFVLRGLSSRTVLIRAVGPSLSAFGIPGVMSDPKIELFDNDRGGVKIGENDNWGGDAQLVNTAKSVGAFDLTGADTKDAVLLITLPAGAYSARLSGVGSASGVAIVEVYEVP